jgi:hypothetical protein
LFIFFKFNDKVQEISKTPHFDVDFEKSMDEKSFGINFDKNETFNDDFDEDDEMDFNVDTFADNTEIMENLNNFLDDFSTVTEYKTEDKNIPIADKVSTTNTMLIMAILSMAKSFGKGSVFLL